MTQEMVRCLRALGDENRLRILALLQQRELCVLELEGALELSQPLVSSHLAVLREAGLATARREGRRMHYALSAEARSGGKHGLVRQILRSVAGDLVFTADRKRLAACEGHKASRGECSPRALESFRNERKEQ